MGCTNSRKENKISFTDQEIQLLQKVFDKLKNRYPETSKENHLCQDAFEYLFEGRPQLGSKLYKFMVKHSKAKNQEIIEILVKDQSQLHLQQYRTYEKVEVLNLISLQRLLSQQADLKDQKISYLEALTFLQEVEYICVESGLALTWRSEQDESVARAVLESIYNTSQGSISWWNLMLFIKQLLPHLSEQIRTFFKSKFLSASQLKTGSKFNKPSYVMSNNQFIYLALSNIYLQSATSISLIWGSAQNKWNFTKLFEALTSFDGPTLILMRFEDTSSVSPDDPAYLSSVCGCFNRKPFLDQPTYQGNQENILFQLAPRIKFYQTQRITQRGGQSFSYLRSKAAKTVTGEDLPRGLGFGGQNDFYGSFRLWIDEDDIQHKSYVMNEDDTYKHGYLIDPDLKQYKLGYMEVWGISKDNESLSTQILIERASVLESHYLRQAIQTQRGIIQVMKDNNPQPQEELEKPQQRSEIRSTRKEKVIDLIGSKPNQEPVSVYQTKTNPQLIRSNTRGYLQDQQLQSDLEILNQATEELIKKYDKAQ